MNQNWNEEEISKALKAKDGNPVPEMAFDRVWFRIEDAIEQKRKRSREAGVWRPWNHPVGWLAAACCLMMLFGSVRYHQATAEQTEVLSYLKSIADPSADDMDEAEVIQVSALLSEPSPGNGMGSLISDEETDEEFGEEGGLLL